MVWELLKDTFSYVIATLLHNYPALLLGILAAALIQVYMDPQKMKSWLTRRSGVSVPAAVGLGAFTPFCACGTMAVVLSMLAAALPWGPVMAFLTSSPLMSPEEFILISGVISPTFAISLTVASVLVGVGAGYATHIIEKKTNFLKDQIRFTSAEPTACGCANEPKNEICGCATAQANPKPASSCCGVAATKPVAVSCCAAQPSCGCNSVEEGNACCPDSYGVIALEQPRMPTFLDFIKRYKVDQVLKASYEVGIKRILPLFAVFAAIGYVINRFIPAEIISMVFGAGNGFSVPLAALIGLPLYVNGDSSIPLIQSLMQHGVGPGAMMAFMITGPGTSAGVLAGISTIMKKKALLLYTAYLFFGAVILGYAYDLFVLFTGKV
jgi:uncharacterized protein